MEGGGSVKFLPESDMERDAVVSDNAYLPIVCGVFIGGILFARVATMYTQQ